jgi:sulfonate dioxygenase
MTNGVLIFSTHIAQGADFQVRAVWKPRSVVLWDSESFGLECVNRVADRRDRVTAHTAIGDYDPSRDGFRHGARITPQAERPFL